MDITEHLSDEQTAAAGPNAWPKSPKGDPNSTN
jgi:hypothetical protein